MAISTRIHSTRSTWRRSAATNGIIVEQGAADQRAQRRQLCRDGFADRPAVGAPSPSMAAPPMLAGQAVRSDPQRRQFRHQRRDRFGPLRSSMTARPNGRPPTRASSPATSTSSRRPPATRSLWRSTRPRSVSTASTRQHATRRLRDVILSAGYNIDRLARQFRWAAGQAAPGSASVSVAGGTFNALNALAASTFDTLIESLSATPQFAENLTLLSVAPLGPISARGRAA